MNSRYLYAQSMRVVKNGRARTDPLTIIQAEPRVPIKDSTGKDTTGFVPILISSMHDGPGLFNPRLTPNSLLQLIGKIKDNTCIAIIVYEHLAP